MTTKTLIAVVAMGCLAAHGESVSSAPAAAAETPDPATASAFAFDAGADLRIRQELMDHVPGLPNGGFRGFRFRESGYRNHIRFRPRVWAEVKADAGDAGV